MQTHPEPSPSLPPLAQHPHVYRDVLALIGDTPLVDLTLPGSTGARIWGKLESMNPGGSVKDRICLAMIEEAERNGTLVSGSTVIEPTSGNTGVGLALVCAHRGYRCVLTMPESMSLERRALLESMGAELVLTPAELQLQGAIDKARELASQIPNSLIPQQFDNPANPEVHMQTTAQEIVFAMGELSIDAFIAGVGTGGTVSGVGRVLRELHPACRIIAAEPETCATISRGEVGPTKIQGLAAGFVPKNYDPTVVHEVRTVGDRVAWETKRELGRSGGILIGISAGAALAVARDVAAELTPNQHVVVVLPDTGERYFSLDEYFA